MIKQIKNKTKQNYLLLQIIAEIMRKFYYILFYNCRINLKNLKGNLLRINHKISKYN
jgi:hypothetical protein